MESLPEFVPDNEVKYYNGIKIEVKDYLQNY